MRTTLIAALMAAAAMAIPTGLDAQGPQDIAQGAQVWADNCTRCHNARPSQERSDDQWLTIVLHMRARANLTRTDARLVASFMQATNLPEATAAAAAPEPDAAAPDDGRGSDAGRDEPAPDLLAVIRYLEGLAIWIPEHR